MLHSSKSSRCRSVSAEIEPCQAVCWQRLARRAGQNESGAERQADIGAKRYRTRPKDQIAATHTSITPVSGTVAARVLNTGAMRAVGQRHASEPLPGTHHLSSEATVGGTNGERRRDRSETGRRSRFSLGPKPKSWPHPLLHFTSSGIGDQLTTSNWEDPPGCAQPRT